jgi:hypothetical protein
MTGLLRFWRAAAAGEEPCASIRLYGGRCSRVTAERVATAGDDLLSNFFRYWTATVDHLHAAGCGDGIQSLTLAWPPAGGTLSRTRPIRDLRGAISVRPAAAGSRACRVRRVDS